MMKRTVLLAYLLSLSAGGDLLASLARRFVEREQRVRPLSGQELVVAMAAKKKEEATKKTEDESEELAETCSSASALSGMPATIEQCRQFNRAVEKAVAKERGKWAKELAERKGKEVAKEEKEKSLWWRYDLATEKLCEGLNALVSRTPYALIYFHRGGDDKEKLFKRLRCDYENFEMRFLSIDVDKYNGALLKCLDIVGMPEPPAYGVFHENILSKTLRGDAVEDNIRYQINEQLAKDPRNYAYFNNRAFDLTRWYQRNEELMGVLPVEHQERIAPALLEESFIYGTPLGQGSWGDPWYQKYDRNSGGGQQSLPHGGSGVGNGEGSVGQVPYSSAGVPVGVSTGGCCCGCQMSGGQ